MPTKDEWIACEECGLEVRTSKTEVHPHHGDRICRSCHEQLTMEPWENADIVNDSRIDHEDPRVKLAAEFLHANESLDKHIWINKKVCPYCALRASRVVRICEQRAGFRNLDAALEEGLNHG